MIVTPKQNTLGTKNGRYRGIFKANKKNAKSKHILKTAQAKSLSTVLVT